MAVALFHLADVPLIGQYAVNSFFVLSGYLMTAVMADSYGYTAQGRVRFFLNRALRLYPGYWISILLTLILIGAFGRLHMAGYHPGMQTPETAKAWAQNLSMLFLDLMPPSQLPRLTPPSWALTVEWLYYFLIGIGLGRSRLLSTLWLGASLLGVVTIYIANPYSSLLYGSLPSGSLGFAAGAWAYHHRDALTHGLDRILDRMAFPVVLAGLCGAFVLPFVTKKLFHLYADPVGNWCNVAMSALLLILLKDWQPVAAIRRLDRWMGDLSYPIYLLHWQAGAIASFLLFQQPVKGGSMHGLMAFALALPIVLLLSVPQIWIVDPLITRYRNAIRAREALRDTSGEPALSS